MGKMSISISKRCIHVHFLYSFKNIMNVPIILIVFKHVVPHLQNLYFYLTVKADNGRYANNVTQHMERYCFISYFYFVFFFISNISSFDLSHGHIHKYTCTRVNIVIKYKSTATKSIVLVLYVHINPCYFV